jgi:hypothetical protein
MRHGYRDCSSLWWVWLSGLLSVLILKQLANEWMNELTNERSEWINECRSRQFILRNYGVWLPCPTLWHPVKIIIVVVKNSYIIHQYLIIHNVTCCVEGWIEIPIARQRIRITYPRIQLPWQPERLGYCCILVTVCRSACIMTRNRPTIDNNRSPRLCKELSVDYQSSLITAVGDEVCDGSLKESGMWSHQNKSGIRIHHSSSSRKILRSDLCQLGPDEKPEEVAGSCNVIRSVIKWL